MLGVKMACSFTQAYFRPEVDCDVNMPKLDSVVRGEQEPCVE